jgi:hypothetical protein
MKSEGPVMETDSLSIPVLSAKLIKARGGVFDPAKMVAAELQNITDVLVEILKEVRRNKP